ncbi:MAG: cellulase family glycosylhydrolase [Oscillospiraceae bacterium]
MEGGEKEWDGGTADGREALNILTKAFVETVRATGGNNSTRGLLITIFAAQPVEVSMKELEIPDDPNIIVSIHAYTPYRYTWFVPKLVEAITGVYKQ